MGIKYVCDNEYCQKEVGSDGLYRFVQKFDVYERKTEDSPHMITNLGFNSQREPFSGCEKYYLCESCIRLVCDKYSTLYLSLALQLQDALKIEGESK